LKNKIVLIVSANYFTIVKFRYFFVSKLIEHGYKVVLFASDDSMSHNSVEKLEELGATCIKSNLSRGSYSVKEATQYIYRYSQIVRRYLPSMVINFTLQPMVFGGIICRLNKLRFISVVTGLGSQYHGNTIKRWLLKFAYNLSVKYSNQIWFVSQSDAKIGTDKLHLNPKKIRVVYGAGIKIRSNKNSLVEKISTNSKTQIIYMGRIRKDKGIEDFIALANKLSSDDRFSLVIMGSMDSSDEYINTLVNQASEDGLITRIDFNYNNIQYLRTTDVLLLCSRHEGMPTVILEAMANNVIPISTNLSVIDELNRMGANIYTYAPGDIRSLIASINKIEGLTSIKKNGILNNNYEFVSKYFEQDMIADAQYQYFRELYLDYG
jgi:glycosyltransferase involved in cell wall biosynthesis